MGLLLLSSGAVVDHFRHAGAAFATGTLRAPIQPVNEIINNLGDDRP
jgi:hypothetical protein